MVSLCAVAVACGSSARDVDDDSGGRGGSGPGTSAAATGFGAATAVTGGGAADGACRNDTDCPDTIDEYCLPPGVVPCGGAPEPPPEPFCDTDDECTQVGAGYVCDIPRCGYGDQKGCMLGCQGADDCAEGMVCDAYRCGAMTCVSDGDCPVNFECGAQAPGVCNRKPCETDGQCDAGYCVGYSCFSDLGTCEQLAA